VLRPGRGVGAFGEEEARVANQSKIFRPWVVWAFLIAWLAGVLYVGLLSVHWVLGVPWHPVLGLAGAVLFVIFVGGFTASLIGHGIAQIRWSLAERRSVTWRGKLVGWVVNPAPDESGGHTGVWQPAPSEEAAAFLAEPDGAAGAGRQVLVGGVPCRIEFRPDDSWQTSVRWQVSPPDAEPPVVADGRRC
jgi:hypothetical protein